ncbi:MAG: sugar ABC transporter ATP-binding protein [Trueperaceae bacterium]
MLAARNITKSYGAVQALIEGNLEVKAGEVIALLGANGSGKSTLSKIITGVVAPSSGELTLNGEVVNFVSPYAAKKKGITAVYQELSLVPDMTVAENIFLGHEPNGFGQIKWRTVKQTAETLLGLFKETLALTVTPDTPVNELSPSERQIIEILKALSLQPKILILDEATASLDSKQVDKLFELVKIWKVQNMALVFVSHRMEEIFRIADKAVVLRNGKTVGNVFMKETNERELVKLMVGDITTPHGNKTPMSRRGEARLKVSNLKTKMLKGVSFDLQAGELLGLGGLQGQGQEDLLLTLFGAIPSSGHITFLSQAAKFNNPRQAMKQGVAYVPGDRGRQGLLMIRSILENLHLPSWLNYGFPIRQIRARKDASEAAQNLSLKMSSLDAPVSSLSGGNAQKVVIGKWLLRQPKLLLLNDPAKGVDVGSKAEFYSLLENLQNSGTSIILYSSDDDELLGLCHRLLVLQDGQISAELQADTLTKEHLVSASMVSQPLSIKSQVQNNLGESV